MVIKFIKVLADVTKHIGTVLMTGASQLNDENLNNTIVKYKELILEK